MVCTAFILSDILSAATCRGAVFMENAFIFLLIFGVLLLLTAAGLAFSKDPRQSPLLGRVVGIEKMSKEQARKLAREVAGCVAAVGLALVIYCVIGLVGK
jgi:hypothetical protein